MVRATVFTELEIEESEFLGHLAPMAPNGVESLGLGKVDGLRSEGWVCAPELPASLKLYDVHQDTTNGSLQFSYSDGLFNVSLFEQRAPSIRPRSPGSAPPRPRRLPALRDAVVRRLVLGRDRLHAHRRPAAGHARAGGRAFPHDVPIKLTAVQRVGAGLAKIATWLTPMGALSEAGIIESGSPYRDPVSGRRPMTRTTT